MQTIWKEIPRDPTCGQWAALYVTINPQGWIVISRHTYERLGAPPAFQVLFDPVNYRIGIKPSALAGKNAYPAGPQGPNGGKVVRAYRLLQDCSISIPETLQFFDAEIDHDGILILDLRTARVSPRAARHRENRKLKVAGTKVE